MVHLNNTCEITIVKRTPELTVDGKSLSVKIIYPTRLVGKERLGFVCPSEHTIHESDTAT